MDGDIGAWLLKGVITVVVTSLAFAVRGLFTRLREAEARVVALEKTPPPCDAAGRAAQADLQAFKLCVAEHYVRRDDYATQMAGALTRLDAIGVMVARLEERSRLQEADRAL